MMTRPDYKRVIEALLRAEAILNREDSPCDKRALDVVHDSLSYTFDLHYSNFDPQKFYDAFYNAPIQWEYPEDFPVIIRTRSLQPLPAQEVEGLVTLGNPGESS
jgi:hypothetical protein